MAVAAKKKNPRDPSPKNVVATARAGGRGTPGKRWEAARSLLITVLIFLFIRTFFVEAFRIPSGSMEPTLLIGDFLFVNKLVYGPHIPFTSVLLPGYADPDRGDVVVYRSPDERDGNPTVVKRVVGTAGDTLHMREGKLFVNGEPQSEPYAAARLPGYSDEVHPDFEWLRRVALARSRFGAPPSQPTHDSWGPIVVPAEHMFTLGDSRYNSKDARYYGFVPRNNVRGRPLFIYYSYNAVDSDRPLPFITDIRWGRIGDGIR